MPLRIRKSGESYAVEDANGVALAYVYFEDDPSRRGLVNRLSGTDAKAVVSSISRTQYGLGDIRYPVCASGIAEIDACPPRLCRLHRKTATPSQLISPSPL